MKLNRGLLYRKYLKRKFKILTFLLVSLISLSACGQKGMEKESALSQDIQIHYQADSGDYDGDMINDVYDRLSTEEDLRKEKKIITLAYAADSSGNSQMDFWVTSFNQESQEFFIEHTPYSWREISDATSKLNVELGTGKGPDIITDSIFPVNQEILDDGMLMDLAPLMQRSEMTEDKYYSAYKVYESNEKVYGVTPNVDVLIMSIDANVLGSAEVPTMEELLKKLLEYPENVSLMEYGDAYRILQYFLEGSEDVWGMVDWENGKCDFSQELFSDILEVAKKYGKNAEKGYEPVMSEIRVSPMQYEGNKSMESQGRVVLNYYFDNGNFPKSLTSQTFLINSNTKELEGAWAFLSYVLSKKGQNLNFTLTPVHKDIASEKIKTELKNIKDGKVWITTSDGKEVKCELGDDADVLLEEMDTIYSTGRRMPSRALQIHNIICEEAGSYFAGDKSKEAVIDVIESRVDIYLSELQ